MNLQKLNLELISGGLGLLSYCSWKRGVLPLERGWVELLVLLAATVLVPLSMANSKNEQAQFERGINLITGWCLLFSFLLEPGLVAAALALPSLLNSIWLMGNAFQSYLLGPSKLSHTAQFAAYLYLPIGTLAAFSDRLAWAPLDFSPIIILLTAAHFHYTGFLLPWVLSKLLFFKAPVAWQYGVSWAILLGIPAVAIGITANKIGLTPHLETGAATLMAAGGLGLAIWHLGLLSLPELATPLKIRILGLFLCLSAGMVLALLYAWRNYFPATFLTIPWMYALHGTLNTIGVGIFGLLVWGKEAKEPTAS